VLVQQGKIDDLDVLCAALLHDTIEDTETTKAELVEQFGSKVAGIVAEVSDDRSLPKGERKRLQIEHAPHLSRNAKLVKLADKICNLRDIDEHPPDEWPLERRREYFDWAKQVIDGLRGVSPKLEAAFDDAYEKKPSRPAVITNPRRS
jgi:guanosine-3',5'-bis(diphosphate) 3'-pyrophosphohydrolase